MVQVQPKQAKYKYTGDLCIRHAVARPTNKPSCGGGPWNVYHFPACVSGPQKIWSLRWLRCGGGDTNEGDRKCRACEQNTLEGLTLVLNCQLDEIAVFWVVW